MNQTVVDFLAASQPLYRAKQVRAIDGFAIEQLDVPGLELMTRAGEAAFGYMQSRWPDARRLAVVCGAGNNGGDGYVVARLALLAGYGVTVHAVAPPDRLSGDALLAFQAFAEAGGNTQTGFPLAFDDADLLVDGLLGTGLDRPVQGDFATAIAAMNSAGLPILALDIPSGVHADTGMSLGDAVRASATVSFIAWKRGLFTGLAAEHVGDLQLADLGVAEARASQSAKAALLPTELPRLPPRPRCAHKVRHGHVLVVGGDVGYSGAARMAAEAAVRLGAGLVSIATRRAHAAVLNCGRPELMCHGVETTEELAPLLGKATVVVVGPGLGRTDWARGLWRACLATSLPLVMDADGLNLLAEEPQPRGDWILTPHPGEAARLLGVDSAAIQRDRYAAIERLQARYGGVAVLKGWGTLTKGGQGPVYVCAAGNPGMGSGGMGDVLAGAIGSLMAQGISAIGAGCYGVALHATAGDAAARLGGERGLLASDLIEPMKSLLNR